MTDLLTPEELQKLEKITLMGWFNALVSKDLLTKVVALAKEAPQLRAEAATLLTQHRLELQEAVERDARLALKIRNLEVEVDRLNQILNVIGNIPSPKED